MITPWQQSRSCSPLNLDQVNSHHLCYCIRLDQDPAACGNITNLESGVAKLLGNLKWLRYRFLVTKTKSLWMTEALHEKRVRSKNYNFSSQSLFFLFQVKMFLLAISYRFIWSRTASHFSQPFWKRLSVVWISKFRAENKAYCGIK